ncbi:hypothetical protein CR513_53524, partial [Mucuna pruriens]
MSLISNSKSNASTYVIPILYIGSTLHVCPNKFLFSTYQPISPISIYFLSGNTIIAKNYGNIIIYYHIKLDNVLSIPNIQFKMIYIKKNFLIFYIVNSFFSTHCIIQDLPSQKIIGIFSCKIYFYVNIILLDSIYSRNIEIWPYRLRHPSFTILTHLCNRYPYIKINKILFVTLWYMTKKARLSPPNNTSKSQKSFDMIKILRYGNGQEFKMESFYYKHVERKHRHILDASHAFLFIHIYLKFIGLIVIFRFLTLVLDNKTPFEILHDTTPTFINLKIFGMSFFYWKCYFYEHVFPQSASISIQNHTSKYFSKDLSEPILFNILHLIPPEDKPNDFIDVPLMNLNHKYKLEDPLEQRKPLPTNMIFIVTLPTPHLPIIIYVLLIHYLI